MKLQEETSYIRGLISKLMGDSNINNDDDEVKRFTCTDCGDYDYKMYMVNDDIWNQYGNDRNTLCLPCLEKRMGRKLTKDDFSQYIDSPVNNHNPHIQRLMNK